MLLSYIGCLELSFLLEVLLKFLSFALLAKYLYDSSRNLAEVLLIRNCLMLMVTEIHVFY